MMSTVNTKRSKHQRIVSIPRIIDGRSLGYTYSIESRDEACQRISERSNKQAQAQNKCISCQLGHEHKRICRNEDWRIGKLQKAIDGAREALTNHVSYQAVLDTMRIRQSEKKSVTHSKESDSLQSFGSYGDVNFDSLLPQIQKVKAFTFDGCKRRQLKTRRLLKQRKPITVIDRTLPDPMYFAMAESSVVGDRRDEFSDIEDDNFNASDPFGCTQREKATPNTSGLMVTHLSVLDKLPAI